MEQPHIENNEEYIIDLRAFFKVIKKNWIIFAASAILCGLAGYLISAYVLTPKYEASATMIVNTRQDLQSNITYDQINSAKNLVSTYSIILKSYTVLEPAIESLNLRISYNDLLGDIEISPINGTQVMKISAKHENKEMARNIVAEIVKYAPEIIIKTVKAGSVEVVSQPRTEDKPVFPNLKLNTAISAVAGLIVSGCVVFMKAIFNNRFMTDSDIKKQLGLPVLGVIPVITKKN